MRLVVQRVRTASVDVREGRDESIGEGLVVFFGAGEGDGEEDVEYCIDKTVNLRIFPDEDGKMNRSVRTVGGEVLVIPNFTLYGDVTNGRRPEFFDAMDPGPAEVLFDKYVEGIRAFDEIETVASGTFGAMMDVQLVNDGPVTIIVDSD